MIAIIIANGHKHIFINPVIKVRISNPYNLVCRRIAYAPQKQPKIM